MLSRIFRFKRRKRRRGAARPFVKVQRKPFKIPSTWQRLDTMQLCRDAGIIKKLQEKHWLKFANGIETYINPRIRKALAYANYERGTVELNGVYFQREGLREKMLNTFVHELAHHIAHEFLSHKGHGKPWKETMLLLGYKPERLGNLRVDKR